MRKVTLCTIVIVGGVLTSLPFRRPIVDPTVPPGFPPVVTSNGLATGPTQSPFALSPHELIGPIETRSATIPATSRFDADQSSGIWASAIRSDQPTRSRRSVDLPLTFEDLAVPLATPHYTDERFSAVALPTAIPSEPSSAPNQDFVAVPLQMERSQGPVAPPLTEPNRESNTSGRLVSVESKPQPDSEDAVPLSPKTEQTPERIRYWIRQPN